MITFYSVLPQGLKREQVPPPGGPVDSRIVWIDLLEPSQEEERAVERVLGIDVPTREEMSELEASARLYEENGWLFMTATLVTRLDSGAPENSQITFILGKDRLITNRYADPVPFRRFIAYAETHPASCASAPMLMTGLLESIVDRLAESLEKIGINLDSVSTEIFTPTLRRKAGSRNFNRILDRVGSSGDVISKARESLVSLGRLLAFMQQATVVAMPQDQRNRCRTISRDVLSLSDHASFLANKVTFLLDATLGMINIEQNNILKIFSVVTVFMLPPSLIAGIFGMNFHQMPLLQQSEGFWITGGLMLASMLVPYFYFRHKGWL
ncbi:MAG: magnesium transporter CorA family protein [Proteobacteria bacterium]|nr:magnesium transporter CorA family protein [Pseudomonadota bacterium]